MHPGCSVHGPQGTPSCGSRPPRRAAAVHDGSHPPPLPTGAYTVSDMHAHVHVHAHTACACACACASSWRRVDWRRHSSPHCRSASRAVPRVRGTHLWASIERRNPNPHPNPHHLWASIERRNPNPHPNPRHLWASIERRCEPAALVRARERRSWYFWPRRTSEAARRGLDELRVHDAARASGGGGGGREVSSITMPTATPTSPRRAERSHLNLVARLAEAVVAAAGCSAAGRRRLDLGRTGLQRGDAQGLQRAAAARGWAALQGQARGVAVCGRRAGSAS